MNKNNYKNLIYEKESFEIIGACMEVHKELGPGSLEAVYQEALVVELTERGIPFEEEKELEIKFKGKVFRELPPAAPFLFTHHILWWSPKGAT